MGRYFDASGNLHGFLRFPGGAFAGPIDVPVPGNTGTVLRGIDAAGDLVGKYFDSSGGTHGFFLGAGGGFLAFDAAGSRPGTTVANAISNNGRIVGQYVQLGTLPICPFPVPLSHGFLRNPDGSFTAIDFPGAISTVANGIDDSGNITGAYLTLPSSTTE